MFLGGAENPNEKDLREQQNTPESKQSMRQLLGAHRDTPRQKLSSDNWATSEQGAEGISNKSK